MSFSPSPKYKKYVLISFLLPLIFISIGIAGGSILLYSQTGITIEHHRVTSQYDDKIELELNYIKPIIEKSTKVGLIFAHGFSNDRWWGQNLGVAAADVGIHAVAMDYRGHGLSEGQRGTAGTDQNSSKWQDVSDQASGDIFAAWKFLHDIGCENIFIAGHSMGGYCSTRFSMAYPNLINATIILGATYPYIGEDLNSTLPKNILFLAGSNEELFSEEMVKSTIEIVSGSEDAEFDRIYGSFESGNASAAKIISQKGTYLGHLDEPLHPLFHQAILDWVNLSCNALEVSIGYDADYRSKLMDRTIKINSYLNILSFGIILFACCCILALPFLSFSKQDLPCSNLITDIMENYHPKIWVIPLFFLVHLIFWLLGIIITIQLDLLWVPISFGSYIVSGFVFSGIFSWILVIFLVNKMCINYNMSISIFLGKLLKNLDYRLFALNIFKGILLGLMIPALIQICFIEFNLPNIIGDFPAKPKSLFYLIIISLIFMVSIIPEELIIQFFHNAILRSIKKDQTHHYIVFLSSKIFFLGIFGIVVYSLNLNLLAVVFLIGYYAISSFIQMLGIGIYRQNKSSIPTILFRSLFISWAILTFLPFYSP